MGRVRAPLKLQPPASAGLSSLDSWVEPDELKREIAAGRGITLSFDRVCVKGVSRLPSVCVQLYLDDTSNGELGIGNTRFLHMRKETHLDSTRLNMETRSVRWSIVGSNHNVPKGGANHKVPLLGKVVVTGNVPAVGFKEDGTVFEHDTHGLVGGSTFPLEEMLHSLCDSGSYEVPIVNSFFPEGEGGSLQVLTTVVFERDPEAAKSVDRKAFQEKKAALFKDSCLPIREQYIANRDFLCTALNHLWIRGIRDGMYPPPPGAEGKAFTSLSDKEAFEALSSEPGGAMFREGSTLNARMYGHMYIHFNAALPAMHNELEQPAMTNKRVLVHSLHAATTIFKGYQWSPTTLASKVAKGEFDDELTSFLACFLTSIDTIPATQVYTSDYWLVPTCGGENRGWRATQGEDFQVANASSARWDPTKSALPSGRNDCESFAHCNLSRYLAAVELAGGKMKDADINAKDGWDMNAIRKRVYMEAIQGGEPGWSKVPPLEGSASKSVVGFAKWCESRSASYTDEMVALDSLTIVSCIMASGTFGVDLVLGGAYAASRTDVVKGGQRQLGGHAYSIAVLGNHTALMEGTAPVLNRMYAEDAAQAKAVMRFENGLGILVRGMLEKRYSQSSLTAKDVGAEFRPLMESSSRDHTEDFYGKAYISSRALTFDQASSMQEGHGGFLFSENPQTKKLEFGVDPEHPLTEGCTMGVVKGDVIDKTISGMQEFRVEMSKSRSSVATEAPYTSMVRSSIMSVRELCGQRVPFASWREWMKNMYGERIPDFVSLSRGRKDGAAFGQPGLVARVVVTFPNASAARTHFDTIRQAWEGMRSGRAVEKAIRDRGHVVGGGAEVVTDNDKTKESLEHVSRCLRGGAANMKAMMADITLNTIVLTAVMEEPIKGIPQAKPQSAPQGGVSAKRGKRSG